MILQCFGESFDETAQRFEKFDNFITKSELELEIDLGAMIFEAAGKDKKWLSLLNDEVILESQVTET